MIIIADNDSKTLEIARGKLMLRTVEQVRVLRADGDDWADLDDYTLVVQFGNTNIASAALTRSADGASLDGSLSTHTSEAAEIFSNVGYKGTQIVRVFLFDATDALAPIALGSVDADMIYNSYGGGDQPAIPTAIQFGKEDISSGAASVTVTFSTAFASAPRIVLPSVSKASVDDPDISHVSVYGIGTTGFSVSLSATTGNANYDLHWEARL